MFEEKTGIRVVADNKQPDKEQVPIHEKVTLTIKEAAEYSNIGITLYFREYSNMNKVLTIQ